MTSPYPSPLPSLMAPHVEATGADCDGTPTSHVGLTANPTAPPAIPRRRQKTTPVGSSCAGVPLVPWTSKLATMRVHARTAQTSTRAPSEPAPSCQRKVGIRLVESDAEGGPMGRGAVTSIAASSPASATLPCEDAPHPGNAATNRAMPRRWR